jgi:hypothetical protein
VRLPWQRPTSACKTPQRADRVESPGELGLLAQDTRRAECEGETRRRKGDAMAVSTPLPRAAATAKRGAGTPARQARLRSCYRASALVGVLLGVVAGVGLFVPGLYQDNTAFAATAFRGTDLVSLAVALPVLAGSQWLASRGSRRALLVWLGGLAYVAYTYLYSFAIAWNRLFLVYVALLSLSLFTLVRALTAVDAIELAGRFPDRTPVRGVGAFLWVIGGMLGLMELAQVVPALVAGQVPDVVLKTGHPTGVIYVLDLGLVVPLMLMAGHWVRQRRPLGYVAAAILLVKGVAVGLALLSSNLVGYLDKGRTDGPLLGLWALIAVGSLLVLVRYLQPMHDRPVGRAADPTAG